MLLYYIIVYDTFYYTVVYYIPDRKGRVCGKEALAIGIYSHCNILVDILSYIHIYIYIYIQTNNIYIYILYIYIYIFVLGHWLQADGAECGDSSARLERMRSPWLL